MADAKLVFILGAFLDQSDPQKLPFRFCSVFGEKMHVFMMDYELVDCPLPCFYGIRVADSSWKSGNCHFWPH